MKILSQFLALAAASTALFASPAAAQTGSTAGEEISVLGYLEPLEDRNLTTSEAGRISEISLKEGDPVKKGQAISKLHTAAHDAGLEIAKLQRDSTASVDAATAERDVAQIKVDALERLGENTRNPSEFLRAKANLLVAEAKLQSALEEKAVAGHQVTKLEGEIERRYIISPIDGYIVRINLDVSEYLSPSEESVVHVVQLDKLRIIVHVKDIYCRALKTGMPLPVAIGTAEMIKNGTAENTVGIIEQIDLVADPASGTRRVKLLIDNPELKYSSGAQAYVTVARKSAP